MQATKNAQRIERSQQHESRGWLPNIVHALLRSSLALAVSKTYFESNVMQIIVDQKHIELCTIPAISIVTDQKWEV